MDVGCSLALYKTAHADLRSHSDKKNATTYQLFHRSQDDPLIHDPEADDRILHPISGDAKPLLPIASTTKSHTASATPSSPSFSSASDGRSQTKANSTLAQLEAEFGPAGVGVRANEGEAANHGIYYDDTNYDYMQHLYEIGGDGAGGFVEPGKGKGKKKGIKLEDALRMASLEDEDYDGSGAGSVYSGGGGLMIENRPLSTVSSYVRPRTYQNQQDVPDAIAGFQPDMDPRLREALEALEDDAFVDKDEDGGLFEDLVEHGAGAEVDPDEWHDRFFDLDEDGDDGWESDATEKAPAQPDVTESACAVKEDGSKQVPASASVEDKDQVKPMKLEPPADDHIPDAAPEEGEWLRNFAEYQRNMRQQKKEKAAGGGAPSITGGSRAGGDTSSVSRMTASTLFTAGGTPVRSKRRKGALTNPSSYSMTSSALNRTEGHRLLDDRFERFEALYSLDEDGEDEDGVSLASGLTGRTGDTDASDVPSLVDVAGSSGFGQIMDGFLDQWTDRREHTKRKGNKGKRGKNGNEQLGMRMLDEVRQGLGPAKIPNKS